MNRQKTVHMGQRVVTLQGIPLKNVKNFKYLDTTVNLTHNLEPEARVRLQGGWSSWKQATRMLCGKCVSAKLKGRVYKAAVRPLLLYGAETWTTTKAISRRCMTKTRTSLSEGHST